MKIAKKLLIAVSIIIASVIGIKICITLLFQTPTTEEIKKHFSEHQSEFETTNKIILAKLKEGKPIDSIQKDTLAYREIEVSSLPFQSVKYYTHYYGLGVGTFGFGIAYLEKKPNNIYQSLEAMQQDAGEIERFTGYGHLSNSWYYFRFRAD